MDSEGNWINTHQNNGQYNKNCVKNNYNNKNRGGYNHNSFNRNKNNFNPNKNHLNQNFHQNKNYINYNQNDTNVNYEENVDHPEDSQQYNQNNKNFTFTNHKYRQNTFHDNSMKNQYGANSFDLNRKKNSDTAISNEASFFCKTCDRSFFSDFKYQQHLSEHRTCGIDGCPFTAHQKLVEEHINNQHITGFYDKIKNVSTPEDIDKWRRERRKNHFCTKGVMEQKQSLQEAMDRRGERIRKNDNRFGKDNSRMSLVKQKKFGNRHMNGSNDKNMNGGTRNFSGERRHDNRNINRDNTNNENILENNLEKKTLNIEEKYKNGSENRYNNYRKPYERNGPRKFGKHYKNSDKTDIKRCSRFIRDEEVSSDKSDWKGTMFPFRGTKQLNEPIETIPEETIAIDDTEWLDMNAKQPKPEKCILNNALASIIGAYGSSDESEIDEVTQPVVFTSNESLKIQVITKTTEVTKPKIEDIQPEIEEINLKIEEILQKPDTNTKESQDCTSFDKTIVDSDDEAPLEVKINCEDPKKQESSSNIISENGNVQSNTRNNNNKGKKRRRNPGNCQKDTSNNRQTSVYYKRRRITLLEKLLDNDIRHERNFLLQCVRHVVSNNFFDKMISK